MKVFDEGLFHEHAERTPPELHNFKGSNWHPHSSCIIAEEPRMDVWSRMMQFMLLLDVLIMSCTSLKSKMADWRFIFL